MNEPTHESPYRLSVVMIVKNEASNLAISLPALHGLADEIVILDSGSTDNSKQIAQSFGAKWYVNTHWQGFGKQRQLAQSYATGDWILALDADEEITPQLHASISYIKNTAPNNTVYGIKRIDCIFGHAIDNPYWAIKAHWRLYPSTFGYNDNLVHESVLLGSANTAQLSGFLHHHTAPTPLFWLQKRLDYAKAWADERQKRSKSISCLGIISHSMFAFIKQYLLDGRFLQGKYGFIYALLFTQYTFNKYACLYDLTHNRAKHALLQGQLANARLTTPPLNHKQSTLSLVMIIKNEAKQLKDCLDSVADICDEIILLDSGSTDDTKKIAKSYPHPNLQWHENHHWQGFGKQRQLAQNYATSDYILVLDADERLDGRLREAIVAVLNEPVRTDVVYSLARVNYFSGVATHLRGWYRDWEHRLYARKTFGYNDLEVHESVDYQDAKLVKLAGLQAHYTNDNLFHYLKKRLQYSHDWALDATKRGKNISLFGACMRALFSFLREYLLRGQLLAGAYGFVASVAIAFYTFNKYLLLWQNKQESR